MATVEERLARAQKNSPNTYAKLNGTQTPAQVAAKVTNTVSTPTNKSFQVQGNIYTDKNVPKEVGQMVTNNNYANDINKLTQAQTAKAIMDLENRRNSVLSSLNQEKSQIEPKYQQAKMQANTTSQLGARNFAEFMAQRGLTNSGVNAQAEINRVGTLQRNINNLTTEENKAYQDIARRTTDANTAYANDVASASMGIEADKLKMLMDAKAKAEETAYARSRDTLADNRYNDELTYNRLQDTKKETIDSYKGLGNNIDYQAKINEIRNDGDPSNDYLINHLMQFREEKIQTKAKQDLENQINQLELANAQIEAKAKQAEAQFKSSPEYLKSLYDGLSSEKTINDLKIQQLRAEIANTQSITANRVSGGGSGGGGSSSGSTSSKSTSGLSKSQLNNAALSMAGAIITEEQAKSGAYWNNVGSYERKVAAARISQELSGLGVDKNTISTIIKAKGLGEFL